MRQLSPFAIVPTVVVSAVFSGSAICQDKSTPVATSTEAPQKYQTLPKTVCSPSVVRVYPSDGCKVVISRDKPGSPLPVQVPADTKVFIEVRNPHPTEFLKYEVTTDQVASPDNFLALIKSAVQPISTVDIRTAALAPETSCGTGYISFGMELNNFTEQMALGAAAIKKAGERVACVQNGEPYNDKKKGCETNGAAAGSIGEAISNANSAITSAENETFPSDQIKAEDTKFDDLLKKPNQTCSVEIQDLKLRLGLISDKVDQLTKAQVALRKAYIVLNSPLPTNLPFEIDNGRDKKAAIKVTAQDTIGASTTIIATVTVTWQSSSFVLTTGVMLSTLKNQTFTNAPIIVDGQPVLDPTGKTLTQVSVSTTRPSVVFPLVMAHYRLPFGQSCRGSCSFLIGGGLGANLSSKTADFAIGPSWKLKEVVFSPVLHYGRQTRLTNGVTVGQKLGASPPNPLPTNGFWTPAFGLGISYVVPVTGAAVQSK